MRRRSHHIDIPSTPPPKYSLVDPSSHLNLSSSLDNKLGSHRAHPPPIELPHRKIKSNASFTLEKLLKDKPTGESVKRTGKSSPKNLKLPNINRSQIENPERSFSTVVTRNEPGHYYLGRIARAFETRDASYLVALSRQHYTQTL